MKAVRLSLFILSSLLLLSAAPLFAQDDKPRYLPNILVIKYEDEQTLSELRLKNRAAPKSNIQSFLTTFGASQPQPLMSASSRTAVRRKMQSGQIDISREQLERAANEIERIYTVRFVADVDAAWLAAKVSRLPGVEYAEPKYLRYTQAETNDPITNSYEDFHNFIEAWDVTQGSREVKIAIIDSGVEYTHTELDDKMWINQDEVPPTLRPQVDQDADGTITSTEIYQYLQQQGNDYNGDGSITLQDALADSSPFMDNNDRDDNGFEDDLYGWDFWDSGYTDQNITEDNNPIMDANSHGTHVAGIAAAETDNATGIAGTGFNSGYMPVKAGGVEDDPSTPDVNESRAIGFGPEGILYAANNGAEVINCSWGGAGFSQAENDIISYATSLGSVVVGASGNSGASEVIYPAAHPDAIAVGSIEDNNTVANYSNVGFALDVLATGSDIQSTIGNNQIGSSTGTSMSAPVVSGLAALLRDLHPGWSAKRIARQIRASAIPLGNSPLLGHGKVDAQRAVSTNLPGLEIEAVSFLNQNGSKLGFDEDGNMQITLVNYGAPASGLELNAGSLVGNGIELSSPTTQVGSIGTNDTVEVDIPLRITLDFNLSETPTFSLVFSDASSQYTDYGILQYDDLLYDIMAANRVKMSVSADGTIGFTDPLLQQGGVGFIPRQNVQGEEDYEEGENLLFEGGLMLEMDGTLHDAVRTVDGELSRDFNPQSTFRLNQSGASDLQGSTSFSTDTVNFRSANIDLTSYAYDDPELSNVVFLLYEIQNPYSFFEFNNVYAGLFNDWDLGNSSNNSTAFSPQDSILYVYDEDPESSHPMVAVATVGPLSSTFAIDNAAEGTGVNFGIYDGFTDAEKSRSLKAGTQKTQVLETDVSAVVASGPYNVAPRATVRVGFVYAFGADEEELRSQIEQARSRAPFEVSRKGIVLSDEEPDETEFFQNYPNPFNPSTRLRLDLSQESSVNITVYNAIGQKVTTLVDSRLEPRIHIFDFHAGSLSSGIYFARLKTENRTKTIKMVLVK